MVQILGSRSRFEVTCRKFFCDNRDCKRRIFAEPLPAVAERYARKTCRLADALRELCYLVGGEAAARIARTFGLLVSPDALLNSLKERAAQETAMSAPMPRVLGIDDFAFRRGHTYGTVLVDLEKRVPVDLLPDREASSVEAWLKVHPCVEIVSRDRGNCYIEGATQGAPNAVQVADRWHLLKNLGDALERLLIRQHKSLRQATQQMNQDSSTQAATEETTEAAQIIIVPPAECPYPQRSLTRHEQDQQRRRDRRLAHYEEVRALHRQGWTARAIGRKTGLDRRTVHKFVHADVFPEIAARPQRESKILPFAEHLKRRWAEGCHNGALLRRELQAVGYVGSQETVDRFLRAEGMKVRDSGNAANNAARHARLPSPRRIAWLLTNTKNPKAEERDRQLVQRLGETCPEVQTAAELGTAFCALVRERRANELDAWIEKVAQDGPPELRRFAKGLLADEKAVRAALSLTWSNGQTEGQVNRLKSLKRQMYGRASFDLLRARVLPSQ